MSLPLALPLTQLGPAQPRMLLLAMNYRFHWGSLRLASVVMSVLWKAYLKTVDELRSEVGQSAGPTYNNAPGLIAAVLTAANVEFS